LEIFADPPLIGWPWWEDPALPIEVGGTRFGETYATIITYIYIFIWIARAKAAPVDPDHSNLIQGIKIICHLFKDEQGISFHR
jgi:hypothetical protein